MKPMNTWPRKDSDMRLIRRGKAVVSIKRLNVLLCVCAAVTSDQDLKGEIGQLQMHNKGVIIQ